MFPFVVVAYSLENVAGPVQHRHQASHHRIYSMENLALHCYLMDAE